MAVVATIIGLLALTAAVHYYYTTYNNEQPSHQYNEPYKPPDYWDPPQQQYQEKSVDIFPDPPDVHEDGINVISLTTKQNGLLSDYTFVHEIKSTTNPEDTTFQETTTPYSHLSTSIELGNEIGHDIGPPPGVDIKKRKSKEYYKYKIKSKAKFEPDRTDLNDPIMGRDKEKPSEIQTTEYSASTESATDSPQVVDVNTPKSKKYYNYKINSEIKHDTDWKDMVFVDVNHAETHPTMGRGEDKNSESLTTVNSIPSKGSTTILGNFLKVVIMVVAVLP